MAPINSSFAWLKQLGSLDAHVLTGLVDCEKTAIANDISVVCHHLMRDLGVNWKPQPVDKRLRLLTVQWIKSELEPDVGSVCKRFLLSVDVGVTYTERVYENGDFDTKLAMVKYVTLAIFLDDLIDKDITVAQKAESFLSNALTGIPSDCGYLEQYRKASINLAGLMSDPLAGNMLLHSCTTFIEGCVLEFRNSKASRAFFKICDAATEDHRDDIENLMAGRGFDIPRPFGADRSTYRGSLLPHCWPTWLREKSAVAETFAITSFRAPGGLDLPIHLWIGVVPEMRTIIMYINDMLSFAKELLSEDTASYLIVVTEERRRIGMPGTSPDGGWCLRDTIKEVYTQIISTGSRINRLLSPSHEARYDSKGSVRSIPELVAILRNEIDTNISKNELMKALCLVLWETHQKGYVAWHFQSQRYRSTELFTWAEEMIGNEDRSAKWILSYFT
jgi:hypothetical protein